MTKLIFMLLFTVFGYSCQSNQAKQATASIPSATAPATPGAGMDEALWTTPLGARLKADYNPNPVSQAAKDQNIIIEYAIKKNLDVKRTTSGLYYLMEKEGKGDSPLREDVVSTHYIGYLLDGTEFNNSYKSGEPLNFGLNEVIAGWTEALLMMKPGGKIKLLIPSTLAFGQNGTPGGPIGPNAVLGFDMELLKVGKR